MSNDKNNLVYREQLDDNVIEMLSEDIGSNYSLRTENTKTIVAALNEILGKDIICNAVGSPLLTTDTFAQMGEKIHVMVSDFKAFNSNGEIFDVEYTMKQSSVRQDDGTFKCFVYFSV